MSESKHTPRPWEIAEGDKEGQMVIQETTTGMGLRIAFLGNLGPERTAANAELLARAPDLLREVEELRARVSEESGWKDRAEAAEHENFHLRAQNAELLEALETCVASLETMPLDNEDVEYLGTVRALVAKVKGGAA